MSENFLNSVHPQQSNARCAAATTAACAQTEIKKIRKISGQIIMGKSLTKQPTLNSI